MYAISPRFKCRRLTKTCLVFASLVLTSNWHRCSSRNDHTCRQNTFGSVTPLKYFHTVKQLNMAVLKKNKKKTELESSTIWSSSLPECNSCTEEESDSASLWLLLLLLARTDNSVSCSVGNHKSKSVWDPEHLCRVWRECVILTTSTSIRSGAISSRFYLHND